MKTYLNNLTSTSLAIATVLVALVTLSSRTAQAQRVFYESDSTIQIPEKRLLSQHRAPQSMLSDKEPAATIRLQPKLEVRSGVEAIQNLKTLDSRGWALFASAIERGLRSKNEGVQQAALRHIIAYGSDLNLSSAAVVDVMRLYRSGKSDQVRRMAVVSLSKMKSNVAMGFLQLSEDFELSLPIRSTISAVTHRSAAGTPPDSDAPVSSTNPF